MVNGNHGTATGLVNAGVVSSFFQMAPNGTVDVKKTLKVFEESVRAHLKAQEDIKPAIVQELKERGRIGEMTLVTFTLHALKLPSTGENQERIKAAIKDMEATGTIVYQTNDSGTRRGRNAGWTLAVDAG